MCAHTYDLDHRRKIIPPVYHSKYSKSFLSSGTHPDNFLYHDTVYPDNFVYRDTVVSPA